MCPGQLGWIITFLLILHCTSGYQDLTCHTDYIKNLTCILQVDPGHEESSPDLTIKWNDVYEELEEFANSCSFTRSTYNHTHMQYTCQMDMYKLMSDDEFNVTITDKLSNSSREGRQFILSQSIKPAPPFNVTVTYFGDYNISWKTPYEDALYYALQDKLQYQLRYKKKQDSWMTQMTKSISQDAKSALLLSTEFQKGSEYEIQVRAQPSFLYSGIWSEWSASTSFRTQSVEEEKTEWSSWIFPISFLMAIFASLAGWKLTQRLWKKMWVLVPNPEPFFQPLYSAHEGDFKSWVGTSYTLNLFDWGLVHPEVLEVYGSRLTKGIELMDANGQPKIGFRGICSLGPSKTEIGSFALGSGEGKDESYGHVSLDTVMVVDDKESGQLHCDCSHLVQDRGRGCDGDDNYSKINLDGDQPDGQGSGDLLLGKEDRIISSGHVSMESSGRIPVWPEAPIGSILEALCLHSPEDWDPGSPISLPSGEGAPFGQGSYAHFSCSSEKEAFGHPLVSLDMDTFDSGFAGSDCGSPLESDFMGGSPVEREGNPALNTSHVEDDTPRSYVKQWVISPPASPDPGSHTS
ncbi:interleukin-21 receptor isoform X1 [Antechinus flavipes]|uniref:interleukin-21 receptor isoform X1 n=1 Tax=Antechinus flavipes TaxID=38775 RepID=UPI002236B97A|nr:interleukin-21 receptor isoform X1 [Antechinus flavipes]XP_051844272.1 interleukin-21 receptor isoform X1 [Antechinus flavipes]